MNDYCTSVGYDSFFNMNESKGRITNHEILENPVSVSFTLIDKRWEKNDWRNETLSEHVVPAVVFLAWPYLIPYQCNNC